MKSKKLKIFAGALVLAGAITICAPLGMKIATQIKEPNESISSQQTYSINADEITVPLEVIYAEDGTKLHKLPAGYHLYHVNDEYPMAGIIGVHEQTEEYTIFNGNTTKTTLDGGETQICSLNGCIGVSEEYWKYLRAAEYLKGQLESSDPNIADFDTDKVQELIRYAEAIRVAVTDKYYESQGVNVNKIH